MFRILIFDNSAHVLIRWRYSCKRAPRGVLKYTVDRLFNFLKDVKMELAKVNWPTQNQTIKYTIVVLGLSLFIAVFLGAWDFVFQLVLNQFIIR